MVDSVNIPFLFKSQEPWFKDETLTLQELVFVEDETNPNLINVYKITFDKTDINNIIPEWGLITTIDIPTFNRNFVDSYLFKTKTPEAIYDNLLNLDFENNEIIWTKNASFRNYQDNLKIVTAFKNSNNIIDTNDDYIMYCKNNKTCLQNMLDDKILQENATIAKNMDTTDIIYFHYDNQQNRWYTYLITKIEDTIFFQVVIKLKNYVV